MRANGKMETVGSGFFFFFFFFEVGLLGDPEFKCAFVTTCVLGLLQKVSNLRCPPASEMHTVKKHNFYLIEKRRRKKE